MHSDEALRHVGEVPGPGCALDLLVDFLLLKDLYLFPGFWLAEGAEELDLLDVEEVLLEANAFGVVPFALILALDVLLVVVLLGADAVAFLVLRIWRHDDGLLLLLEKWAM